MSIRNIISENKQRALKVSNESYASVDICLIQEVNASDLTAEVQIVKSGKVLSGVPFCMPLLAANKGIVCIPEENSFGILATTTKQEPFIIGFASLSETDSDINLYPGEVKVHSNGDALSVFDRAGNITSISSGAAMSVLDDNGKEIVKSITSSHETLAKKVISGFIYGDVGEKEEIFDRDVESPDSVEELVRKILVGDTLVIEKPSPVIIIEKGNVFDENGNKVKLEIEENPENNKELCYRIRIYDEEKNEKLSILVDKFGRIKIMGNSVILDCEKVDLTRCTEVIM